MPKLPVVLMPPGRPRPLVAMAALAALLGLLGLLLVVPSSLLFLAAAISGTEGGFGLFVLVGVVLSLLLFVLAPLAFALDVRAGRPRALAIGIAWWAAILVLDALWLYLLWYTAAANNDSLEFGWLLGPLVVGSLGVGTIGYLWSSRPPSAPAAKASRRA